MSQIFISFKNSDNNVATIDSKFAKLIYGKLRSMGYDCFMSNDSLRGQGIANYKKFIDSALEKAECIIVVGSKNEYMESEWVRYEWDTYLGEVLSGRKKENVFTLRLENMLIADLPISLRKYQSFSIDQIEQLYSFVQNAVKVHQNRKKEIQFVYCAVFSKSENGFDVLFPDLEIKTDGINLTDAYLNAKALLLAYFIYAVKYDIEFNVPSGFKDILYRNPNKIVLVVDTIVNIDNI